MTLIVCDPLDQERLIAERKKYGHDLYDEVWDGVYVMAPSANNEHQEIAGAWVELLRKLVRGGKGRVIPAANVSDRQDDWTKNYRVPDVAVFLKENPATDHKTFWYGGPDWATEIMSPGDRAREKLDFYASIGTKELLLISRDPWMLELYQLKRKKLRRVEICTLEQPTLLTSSIFPISFTLAPSDDDRCMIAVNMPDESIPWRI